MSFHYEHFGICPSNSQLHDFALPAHAGVGHLKPIRLVLLIHGEIIRRQTIPPAVLAITVAYQGSLLYYSAAIYISMRLL